MFKRNTWTNQQLEDTINVVESGHTYLRKASIYYNILLTSLSYHLNGRTRSKKVSPQGVLTEQKDEKIATGSKHAKGWLICQPSTTKIKGC